MHNEAIDQLSNVSLAHLVIRTFYVQSRPDFQKKYVNNLTYDLALICNLLKHNCWSSNISETECFKGIQLTKRTNPSYNFGVGSFLFPLIVFISISTKARAHLLKQCRKEISYGIERKASKLNLH